MNKRALGVMVAALLLAAACGGGGDGGDGDGGGSGEESYDITLIQGVRGDEFYISMACGAQEAADELGVNLNVQGPDEFDPVLQTQVLNGVLAEQPDAILIAPTDTRAMIPPMQEAADAGITIVTVDTTIEADIAVSAIATDNVLGGEKAGQTLAELIGQEGPVLVVNVKPGISTTDQRQQGFEQAIKEFDGIEYLGAEYSNNDPAKAASIVTSTLAAEPDLAGIFATNLFSAEGSATGLRNEGSLGDVKIVGFDASPSQVAQLEEGLVQALVVQQPREIGRLGVEQAVADLKGEEVTPEIATKVVVATEKNLDDPAIADSLYTDEC